MKVMKKNIIGFIIGAIVFGGISYGVASQILATQVSYTNEKSEANVTSVDGALTELYDLAEECINNASSGSTIEYKESAAEAVYLDPTGTKNDCSSSNFKSDTETKDGCMRFYVYAEDGEYKYAILDHNTTAVVIDGFYAAQAQVKQDTKDWNPNLKARNISVMEVYKITESTNNELDWQLKGNLFFMNGENSQGYGWLFDRTNGCESYGCTTEDNNTYSSNTIFGYWTSNVRNSYQAWGLRFSGYVDSDVFNAPYRGVRPVIQITK